MITIAGPFGAIAMSITLPNPELNDGEKLVSRTLVGQSMSGRVVTTVRSSAEKKLSFTFTKLSSANVEYLDALLSSVTDLSLTLYDATVWRVRCLSNPIEYTQDKNFYTCHLEFQGTKQ